MGIQVNAQLEDSTYINAVQRLAFDFYLQVYLSYEYDFFSMI